MPSCKYEKVARRVESLIASGTLRTGDRIPSVREMARLMDVSTMTVLEGYRCLEDLGLVEARPQSGHYVRPKASRRRKVWARLPAARQEDILLVTKDVTVPQAVDRFLEQAADRRLLPLGAGLPDPSLLPSERLSILLARAARTQPEDTNRYSIGAGDPRLRRAIARWMLESGAVTEANEIVVTTGATQALLLALRAVAQPGETVAVESPGYHGFHGLLEFLGLRSIEIPSSPDTGFSVSALAQTLAAPENAVAAVLLSASFSNPTGATMPDAEKERLVTLCRERGIPIIDDDTYGDLPFVGQRPRSLKSFAPTDVLHVGSFSKTLGPGYRIAWVAGGRHNGAILRYHHMAVLSTASANQHAVADYLERGGMSRHLRRLRRQYADNLRLIGDEVVASFPPGTRAGCPAGGHFLWVELPEGGDAVALAGRAFQAGISIAPGILFSSRLHYRRYLRLNGAVVCDERLRNALSTLGRLARV